MWSMKQHQAPANIVGVYVERTQKASRLQMKTTDAQELPCQMGNIWSPPSSICHIHPHHMHHSLLHLTRSGSLTLWMISRFCLPA